MIKKLLLILFSIICFTHAVIAQEIFRVTSVNFDTSNSLIFLTSPDSTTDTILNGVKLIPLQNPKRVYFDINSATLSTPLQNWFLNSGGIKQVKINQFSNNPNKIRVVLYLDENFDQSKISFVRVNNNIAIKYNNPSSKILTEKYFQQTYRDERSSSSDFYENLSISSEEEISPKIVSNNEQTVQQSDLVFNQIQKAFDSSDSATGVKGAVIQKNEAFKKELKLKSKYYLNSITTKPNGFLVSGFGSVSLEKPIYLTNPARVVFDIPNAIASTESKNKEVKIVQDLIKIGQYEPNKIRIVVTSNQLEKYFPIFSSDGQSIFFTNSDAIDLDSICTKINDATAYKVSQLTSKSGTFTNEFVINFNSPVVHSVRRDNSKLVLNCYNTLRYNDQTFKNAIKSTQMSNMRIDLLPKVGIKLTLPLEKTSTVSTYIGADGKSIKVVLKGVRENPIVCLPVKTVILPKCKVKSYVVIDPGHGGSDYGAIRSGINEKDINLDVAKRLQVILEEQGIDVCMTRNIDEFVSLQDRTVITEKEKPDIFVSVHVNSSVKPEITGIETHYYHPESLGLARDVHESLMSFISTKDRGLFKSRFYVINHTTVPAILVEIGFISNDEERAELVSETRKQDTAKAIADGILKYLNKK